MRDPSLRALLKGLINSYVSRGCLRSAYILLTRSAIILTQHVGGELDAYATSRPCLLCANMCESTRNMLTRRFWPTMELQELLLAEANDKLKEKDEPSNAAFSTRPGRQEKYGRKSDKAFLQALFISETWRCSQPRPQCVAVGATAVGKSGFGNNADVRGLTTMYWQYQVLVWGLPHLPKSEINISQRTSQH